MAAPHARAQRIEPLQRDRLTQAGYPSAIDIHGQPWEMIPMRNRA
jgi:hypothetical protein